MTTHATTHARATWREWLGLTLLVVSAALARMIPDDALGPPEGTRTRRVPEEDPVPRWRPELGHPTTDRRSGETKRGPVSATATHGGSAR